MTNEAPDFDAPFYAGITRDDVFLFIREKGIGGSCPRCKSDAFHPLFTVDKDFVPNIVARDPDRPLQVNYPGIACFLIMCSNCGYISPHALSAVTAWLKVPKVHNRDG